MTSFSPAELRLLAISDRVDNARDRWVEDATRRRGGRQRSNGVGRLTTEQVIALLASGERMAAVAAAAGVTVRAVRKWRKLRGIP